MNLEYQLPMVGGDDVQCDLEYELSMVGGTDMEGQCIQLPVTIAIPQIQLWCS